MKQPKIIQVDWRDACTFEGYEKHGLVNISTCGFLVHENEEYLTVASDWFDGSWRNSHSIPKVNIVRIITTRKENEKKFTDVNNSTDLSNSV